MNFKELLSLKNIKNTLIYLSIAGISVFTTKACIDNDVEPVIPKLEPVKEYVDINNQIHSVITQQAIEKKEQKHYVDSLSTVLKVKEKDIQSITKSTQEVNQQFPSKTDIQYLPKDTIYSIHKKDNWIDISAFAGRDSGTILLGLKDTLTHSTITKRRLFSTISYVDIHHSNPYITTTTGYSLTFKEKTPIIVIGPYIGYGYNGKNFSPSIGISATIPLIRIK